MNEIVGGPDIDKRLTKITQLTSNKNTLFSLCQLSICSNCLIHDKIREMYDSKEEGEGRGE